MSEIKRFKVRWYDSLTGEGVLREVDTKKSYVFYACNFKHANSMFPHLVTNVSLEKGLTVYGIIPEDIYTLRACGIDQMQYPTKELIMAHDYKLEE